MQIDAIQAEQDVVLPAKLALPGSSRTILTHKVMAITGRRFVTAGATAAQQPPGAQAAINTTGRPRKQPRRTRAKSSKSDGDQAAMPAVATDCPDSVAMDRVADAINGNSPGCMTVAQTITFAHAASFCNADAILKALPDYTFWSADTCEYSLVRALVCTPMCVLCRKRLCFEACFAGGLLSSAMRCRKWLIASRCRLQAARTTSSRTRCDCVQHKLMKFSV